MSHIVHDSWRALAEENLQWMEKWVFDHKNRHQCSPRCQLDRLGNLCRCKWVCVRR
jgi:hypothetical protein